MNERLKELAEQAGIEFGGEGGDAAWKNLVIFEKEDLKKFAELIVEECAQTLRDNTPVLDEYESEEDWDRGYGQAMRDCVHHIREHFGVEE